MTGKAQVASCFSLEKPLSHGCQRSNQLSLFLLVKRSMWQLLHVFAMLFGYETC
uniref:Uncharacterized protein n=1 Tax=Brassica oleracea var. oleracea TaxID=109376 RepID=A0A0D3E4G2_BRAOL